MDDRPRKLLSRLDDGPRAAAMALLDAADGLAADAGKELQPEFGPDHVALIVGCNQFVRFRRAGDDAGHVELWLDDAAKKTLAAAGFTLHDPHGAIFRMFGWVRIDPHEGDPDALRAALGAAFAKAHAKAPPAPT